MSRDTFHGFNRAALLSILGLSFVLPAFTIQTTHPSVVNETIYGMEMELSNMPVAVAENTSLGWCDWMIIVYCIGVALFAIYYLASIISIHRILNRGRRIIDCDGTNIVIVADEQTTPFSWFNNIVLNEKDFAENSHILIAHEKAHIARRHSFDVVMLMIFEIIEWFNPFIWLFSRELRDVHEYEADKLVIQQGIDAKTYKQLLITKAIGGTAQSLTNGLVKSTLKKRFTMMYKKQSSKWAMAKYIYVLPIALIALAAYARPITNNDKPKNNLVTIDSKQTSDDGTVYFDANDLDKVADFPGGVVALMQHLAANMKYPAEAVKKNEQGKVLVKFIVETDGSLSNFGIAQSVSPLLDAEALRVAKTLPNFTPAEKDGKKVRMSYALPVSFRLE